MEKPDARTNGTQDKGKPDRTLCWDHIKVEETRKRMPEDNNKIGNPISQSKNR